MTACWHQRGSRLGTNDVYTETAYIKDDEVEEDKENVHHDPHDQLQLADDPPGVLQGVRQILTLLIDLHM